MGWERIISESSFAHKSRDTGKCVSFTNLNKNRPFDIAKAGSFNEQNVGEWCLVRNEAALCRPMIVTTCSYLFDDCCRSAEPKGQQAVFTRIPVS